MYTALSVSFFLLDFFIFGVKIAIEIKREINMKFQIDHDLHIHSELSSCSANPQQTPERILDYAKENNLKTICLTDHFWDERVEGASEWYAPQNFGHIANALPLPEEEGISFLFGCETEMDKFFTLGISEERLDAFDFIIVPTSHLHMKGFTVEESLTSATDRAKYYMERCNRLLDMKLPFYKMGLAHFTCTLMQRNCDGTRDDIMNAISDSEFYDFFKKAAKCGIGIELNTSVSDASNPAALRPYLIAKECGCKFYLGSDAHSPGDFKYSEARFSSMIAALDLKEEDKFSLAKTK